MVMSRPRSSGLVGPDLQKETVAVEEDGGVEPECLDDLVERALLDDRVGEQPLRLAPFPLGEVIEVVAGK